MIDVFKRISVERDHVSNFPFFCGAKGVQLARNSAGFAVAACMASMGVKPASTKQGKFIVQIDAWTKRPIREIGSTMI